ncbi:MAG: YceI family protein [Lentisphaerae bacterium]|nr:YceI family protein [Lentisphaerota bacterium]
MNGKRLMAVLAGMLVVAGLQAAKADDAAPAAPAVTTFAADLAHSKVAFRVQHLMISKVSGEFKDYTGTLQLDGHTLVGAEAVIKAASIDTANAKRDEHLRSPDFFDVAKFETLTFKSTGVKGDTLVGDLTIHGVTKSVELKYALSGPVQDPWGNTKLGFEASGKISRADFGLTWNKALEAGGLLVGDEVDLNIEMELAKQ